MIDGQNIEAGVELNAITEALTDYGRLIEENERLKTELEESKAETAACLGFLSSEHEWECFRAEMLLSKKPVELSISERNAQKLHTFLAEKGHGKRLLEELAGAQLLAKEATAELLKVGAQRDEAMARAVQLDGILRRIYTGYLEPIDHVHMRDGGILYASEVWEVLNS